jgi:hypothetical protein
MTEQNSLVNGNFMKEFPNGATVEAFTVAPSVYGNGQYGILTVRGKKYSVSPTVARVLTQWIEGGRITFPAKLKVVAQTGKKTTENAQPNVYHIPIILP